LARFLPAHGTLNSKQKSCQKGLWKEGLGTGIDLTLQNCYYWISCRRSR